MYEYIILGNKINTLPVHDEEVKSNLKAPLCYNIKYKKKVKTTAVQNKDYEIKKIIFQLKKDKAKDDKIFESAQDQRAVINHEMIQDKTIELAGAKEIISAQSANNPEDREIIQNNAIELTEGENSISEQDGNHHIKQNIIQDLPNTIRTGENNMQLCIIKNCREEAYQDNFCPKHYSEIMKKGTQELANANPPIKDHKNGKHGNTSYEQEDVMTKIQYFLHSFHARIEKIIETAVLIFNTFFNLEKADKAEIYRQLGAKYSRNKIYKKAIPMLKKYVEVNPDDAESQYRLGSAYLSDGLVDDAILCLKKAIMLDSHSMQYHYEIAIAYEQKYLPDEAIASLKNALQINPKNSDACYRLGVLYDNNGEYENAIAFYKKAIDLNPRQSNYYHSLGFAYESIKRHEEAVVNFKRAIALEQLAS